MTRTLVAWGRVAVRPGLHSTLAPAASARRPSRATSASLSRGRDGIGALGSPLTRCPGTARCASIDRHRAAPSTGPDRPPGASRAVDRHRQDNHERHAVGRWSVMPQRAYARSAQRLARRDDGGGSRSRPGNHQHLGPSGSGPGPQRCWDHRRGPRGTPVSTATARVNPQTTALPQQPRLEAVVSADAHKTPARDDPHEHGAGVRTPASVRAESGRVRAGARADRPRAGASRFSAWVPTSRGSVWAAPSSCRWPPVLPQRAFSTTEPNRSAAGGFPAGAGSLIGLGISSLTRRPG